MEVMGGAARRIAAKIGLFTVSAAIGVGAMPGYGSGVMRGLVGVEYGSMDPSNDDDADGVLNAVDDCMQVSEDRDRFEDDDGCPDDDNDGDAVPDVDDECPNEAEDRDRYEDSDGCPDTGHLSLDEAADAKRDRDWDGIRNAVDRCPAEPEDRDDFEDHDGCPDLDNDKDGLNDIADLCPDRFEDQTTSSDKDGCPDEGPANKLATLGEDEIALSAPIDFVRNRAALDRTFNPVLHQVVSIMVKHQELEIQIEVAPTGKSVPLTRLASRRARTIADYLVTRGIEARRIKTGQQVPSGAEGSIQVRIAVIQHGAQE
jgi:outer membrane protein OmpA-like peptidoglycan-associated protein